MRTIFSVRDNDLRMKESAELAYDLINKDTQIDNLTFDELIEQLTPAKKKLVLSAIELFKREQSNGIKSITGSRSAYNILNPLMCDLSHEEFWVLFLNQANKVIKRMKISSGGISETAVDIRLILKNAILGNTSAILFYHNLPSGNKQPCHAYFPFTNKRVDASKIIFLIILYHLILPYSPYFFFSFFGKI